jgi:hypothetical protein
MALIHHILKKNKKENHQMSMTGSGQQVAKNIKGFFKFSTFITGL